MEASILTSTKKILGIGPEYTAFDPDILTHINAALGTLDQLGVGPIGGFSISSSAEEWNNLGIPQNQLNMVRSYVFLKTRLLFDPPTTSFHLEAMKQQIQEFEWRLSAFRDGSFDPVVAVVEEENV